MEGEGLWTHIIRNYSRWERHEREREESPNCLHRDLGTPCLGHLSHVLEGGVEGGVFFRKFFFLNIFKFIPLREMERASNSASREEGQRKREKEALC